VAPRRVARVSTIDRRPARLCDGLLAALDASEGRRRQRKRDTTPDAVGLGIKRELLARAVRDDPDPEEFEGWLLGQCLAAAATTSVGAMRTMALEILAEWRLAERAPDFAAWLAHGAPSEDAAAPNAPAAGSGGARER
jgi:hypothetical protein